jgi:hypothetical protein
MSRSKISRAYTRYMSLLKLISSSVREGIERK